MSVLQLTFRVELDIPLRNTEAEKDEATVGNRKRSRSIGTAEAKTTITFVLVGEKNELKFFSATDKEKLVNYAKEYATACTALKSSLYISGCSVEEVMSASTALQMFWDPAAIQLLTPEQLAVISEIKLPNARQYNNMPSLGDMSVISDAITKDDTFSEEASEEADVKTTISGLLDEMVTKVEARINIEKAIQEMIDVFSSIPVAAADEIKIHSPRTNLRLDKF